MLCSKRAKPPDRLGLLGSSYVMKHLRLVLILALRASVAATCGSSSSTPTTMTDKDVKDGIRAQLVREKIYESVTKNVKVSDGDAKKYYDDHKSQYQQPAQPQSRDVRHILVKSQALANAIYAQLKAGGDFSKLALKDSIDPSKTS